MDGLAIAASLHELRSTIEGGLIRSIHRPIPFLFALGVFANGNHTVLISPQQALVHRSELDLPNPQTPDSFVMLLRKHLRGGRIRAIRQPGWERIAVLEVERYDGVSAHKYELIAELTGGRGDLVLVEGGRVLGSARRDPRRAPGSAYSPIAPQSKLDPAFVSVESMRRLLDEPNVERALVKGIDGLGRATAEDLLLLAETLPSTVALETRLHQALQTVVAHVASPSPHVDADGKRATFYPMSDAGERFASFGEALDRVVGLEQGTTARATDDRTIRTRVQYALGHRARTAAKLRAWLSDAERAGELRHVADVLTLHTADLGRGTREAVIPDPATGELFTATLDPSLDARENAQKLYKRAKRLSRGRPAVAARLKRLDREIRALADALDSSDRGEDLAPEVDALLRPPPQEGKRGPTARLAPRRFVVDGYTVLVGKSATQNDELLRDARPEDAWLHVRGVSGSHVIVRANDRGEIPETVLREAAKLAGRYSKAEKGRRIQVVVAKAKHVRKPKGAPPGLAIVENESTLTVTVEEAE